MENTGLILEGGGMRGAYTAGVLDYFHDENINFPYVVGASAGACNGSSYVSQQRGRNYKVIVEYGDHPEYISYRRALTKKELFGMDFIFEKLPNQIVPFDYNVFNNRSTRFVVGATDIQTGNPVYYETFEDRESLLKIIRASSSLPFIAPIMEIKGQKLLDGGIADPIPIRPSIDAGNEKHVVVLTRNGGYRKRKMKFSWIYKRKYKDYPKLIEAIEQRYKIYNQTMDLLEKMEREGKVFLIRPNEPLQVSRIEKNKEKLHVLYEQGYHEAERQKEDLANFLEQKKPHASQV